MNIMESKECIGVFDAIGVMIIKGLRSKKKQALELSKEMDSWDYGVIQNGKRYFYDNDMSNVNWSKYRTTPVNELKKKRIGTCWDFTNYEYSVLKKQNQNPKAYMVVLQKSDKPDDVVTHTFVTYGNGQKKYWLESAWWKHHGINEIGSIKDVGKKFEEQYGSDKPYSIFEYDPTGIDNGLNDQEYFDRATQKLIYDKK